MKKKAVRVYVSGNVQGVLFRRFTKDSADKLNIKGFVRNLVDGRVEAFLEGEAEKVDKMIEKCRQGPASSYTRKIQLKEEIPQDFKDFTILSS